jgi:hypothetical protein
VVKFALHFSLPLTLKQPVLALGVQRWIVERKKRLRPEIAVVSFHQAVPFFSNALRDACSIICMLRIESYDHSP